MIVCTIILKSNDRIKLERIIQCCWLCKSNFVIPEYSFDHLRIITTVLEVPIKFLLSHIHIINIFLFLLLWRMSGTFSDTLPKFGDCEIRWSDLSKA